ncbi:E3 ubiquitin-protein ligase RNF186 [Salmo salar]|uniref:E3 ubiquitin-protein ligase RNF186 n=1 Tax=Salmo salar TaxID=8030 RepID=A0A1S3MPC8_SALSA|nr:E3 ubiquitin-protein ligase RNF186 [Salmo salar]|eukprot:XP_014004945.1 PREDICTED: RING finger protein 186-like [Salmo salar]
MVLCEDMECGVCYQPYSRQDRIPRVLHCRHTFCATCLETMSQPKSDMITVCCPLCRQTTCVGHGLSLQEALWVNSRLWDYIPESKEEEEEVKEEEEEGVKEEEEQEEEEEEERVEANRQTQASSQAECPTTKRSRKMLKFPAFLRKFSLTKPQHQERIVPSCANVEMKSWRRLPAADTF